MTLPVLIIGAGLGGVCLAQALKKNNIPFKLFEQDEKSTFRAQGYRLRVTKHGVDALKEALTPELFVVFEKTCADTPTIGVRIKPDGTHLPSIGSFGPPPGVHSKSYTVDRSTFREALLTGLEEYVFFGKSLKQYTVHPEKVTVSFADGSTEDGSLLVGADGVRSMVRKQYLPSFQGLDTGTRIIFGKTPSTPDFLAKLKEEYRHGMSLVLDPEDASQPCVLFESINFPYAEEITEPQLPDPYMYWVLCTQISQLPITREKSWHISSQESASISRELTKSWSPSLRAIFDMQDSSQSAIRSILSAMPEIAPWEPSSRVTLLGDAIHVMPPTGAMGANTALRDAADLAHRISLAGGVDGVDKAVIGDYEASLRDFAKMAIEQSWQGGMKSFGLKPVEQCEMIALGSLEYNSL
jgi:2-polyprenyl-6-methoxyphenol hydroxylase-like FAD-dependent oxidoreductase